MFEVKVEAAADGMAVVRVTGEVDITVSAALEQALIDASAPVDVCSVTVDLQGLRFLDSSGVHALVKGYLAAQEAGLPYTVRNASGLVARALHITGVARTLGMPEEADVSEYPKGA